MTATLTSTDIDNDRCPACGKALSRLTTTPLPEEIAGLIARNSDRIAVRVYGRSLLKDNIDALRALAQENERLKLAVRFVESDLPMKTALERIAELEAENDRLRESVNAIRAEYLQHVFDEKARGDQLEAERDELSVERDVARVQRDVARTERAAIRAKTFEECAHFAAMYEHPRCAEHRNDNTQWVAGHDAVCLELEKAIRALAQTDEASQKERR